MDSTPDPFPYETCTFCGSLSVADVLAVLQLPGTRYSGADWKYGWPHKFSIEPACEPYRACVSAGPGPKDFGYTEKKNHYAKFYSNHLRDASTEQMSLWESIAVPLLGIHFDLQGQRLHWRALPGHQASGIVR